MNWFWIGLVIAVALIFYLLMRRSIKEEKKAAGYLYLQQDFDAYDKITGSYVTKLMLTSVAHQDMVLQKNWYLGESDAMLRGLVKLEKMVVPENQSYLVPMNWVKYYCMQDDYVNAQVHYKRMILSTPEAVRVKIEPLLMFYAAVLDFHLKQDFTQYDQIESMINGDNFPVYNSWYAYELAWADKLCGRQGECEANIARCIGYAQGSYFKDKAVRLEQTDRNVLAAGAQQPEQADTAACR